MLFIKFCVLTPTGRFLCNFYCICEVLVHLQIHTELIYLYCYTHTFFFNEYKLWRESQILTIKEILNLLTLIWYSYFIVFFCINGHICWNIETCRDFVENYLVDFARSNPNVVVYVKPHRHRGASIQADYCKYLPNLYSAFTILLCHDWRLLLYGPHIHLYIFSLIFFPSEWKLSQDSCL